MHGSHFLVTKFQESDSSSTTKASTLLNLTQKELAEICSITPRRVRQLVAEGTITKTPNGRYTGESVTEYVQYVRQNNEKDTCFRDLLEQEKYRGLKRQNDEAEKLLAPIEMISEVVEKGVAALIQELENLPELVKKHWPKVSEDQIELVDHYVAECRDILNGIELTFDDETTDPVQPEAALRNPTPAAKRPSNRKKKQ